MNSSPFKLEASHFSIYLGEEENKGSLQMVRRLFLHISLSRDWSIHSDISVIQASPGSLGLYSPRPPPNSVQVAFYRHFWSKNCTKSTLCKQITSLQLLFCLLVDCFSLHDVVILASLFSQDLL